MEVLGNPIDINKHHARMRAISLGDEDTASLNGKLNGSNSDSDLTAIDNNTSSLKTYMTNIVANTPEKNKHELNRADMNEAAGNRSLSWAERQNDYSFMKR